MIVSPGDWPDFRRDSRLSGHQPLAGAIRRPAIQSREYLGGPLFDATTFATAEGTRLLIPFGGSLHCFDHHGGLLWKSGAEGIEGVCGVDDLDRDGRTEIVATNGKSLFVLDASDGAILWREYLGPPFSAGFMHTGALLHHFPHVGPGMQLAVGLLSSREVVVYDFTPGADRPERLHILWMDDFFHPSILAADIDGDGRDELIVTKYSAIYAFDPATGREVSVCHWSSGGTSKRNYGLFLARDLNGDGTLDFVVMSSRVSKHLAVVENDGRGALRNRWDRFIEHIYPVDEKEIRYTLDSCCDIDGDGRPELVVSIFNEKGDERWWLEVLDAWDGRVKGSVPDLYLRGVGLPTGQETARPLFLSRETDRQPADFGTVMVAVWRDDELRELWRGDDASLVGRFTPTDNLTTVFRTELPPSDEVWFREIDGAAAVPVLGRGGELSLLISSGDGWSRVPVPVEPGIVAMLAWEDLDGDGRPEMVLSRGDGALSIDRLDGVRLGGFRAGMRTRHGTGPYYSAKPMQSPTIRSDGERRLLAVPDGGSGIRLGAWDHDASRFNMIGRVEGHGRLGPEEAHHSLPFAEWKGERVVLAAVGDRPVATLAAFDMKLRIVDEWRIDGLPTTPSVPPGRIGIHDYLLIDDPARPLLVVSGYASSSMNSERTFCIDPATGLRLWEGNTVGEGDDGRGCGPWNAWSLGANGRELLFLAKDTVCRFDLATGREIVTPWQLRPYNTADLAARGMTMDDFAAYGSLIPVDVDGDGVEEWIAAAVYGGIGVVEEGRSMRWWRSAPLSTLTGGFPGVADVDGDGLPEIGMSQADGDFVCLRADTGMEKWRLHIGETATDVITCDIDGDGRIEFVFATQQGSIMAVGVSTSGCGLVKWKIALGYSLGPVVAADPGGRGTSEILVVSGDGYLYHIGEARPDLA